MWTPFVFVRFTFWLIVGIIIYLVFEPQFDYWIELFGVIVMIYALVIRKVQISPHQSYFPSLLGSIGLFSILLFGIALTDLRTPARKSNHILQSPDSITHFEAVLTSDLTQKPNSFMANAQVIRCLADSQWIETDSKLIIYFQKSASFTDFQYGTKILVKGTLQLVAPPTNPKSFDYQRYLKYKGIYHQIYVPTYRVRKIGDAPISFLMDFALQIRRKCTQILSKYLENPRSASVVQALILGVKDGIDNELREKYASAGVMHILAVSGLHVGIIFKIIEGLLGFLNRYRRSKLGFALLTTLLLFLYALITGFSPSVVRAVVMFSCVAWANALQRTSSIYNTIAFSAFVMLCYDPYFLTQVGFQLSYLAVIGIVYLYPKLYYRWTPPNRLMEGVWQLVLVSICAQIAVTPISLFYFHQFPVYFLLANLLIVPFISVFIGLGISILVFAIFEAWIWFIPKFLGSVLNVLISWMNEVLFFTNQLPFPLIENISMTLFETILLYGVILEVTCLFVFRQFWIIYVIWSFLLLFIGFNFYQYKVSSTQKVISIYALKSANLGIIDGHQGVLIADSLTIQDEKQIEREILGHWRSKNVYQMKFRAFENKSRSKCIIYKVFNKKILLLNNNFDKNNLTQLPDADILIVNIRFKCYLKKLNKNKFKHIIITGIKPYHHLDEVHSVLTDNFQKTTFINHNQYFELEIE